jgi:hypothetical protein
MRGICIVDASFGDREFKALHDGGVRGARFNFVKHLGGAPDMDLFRRTAERISLPPYSEAVPIAHRIVAAIPDRVLWGTDFPHPNATHEADEADLVDLVLRYAPDTATQKRLLVDNPAKLYGFA